MGKLTVLTMQAPEAQSVMADIPQLSYSSEIASRDFCLAVANWSAA
jgi:hypothetical protein